MIDSTVGKHPSILESRRYTCTWQDFFFSTHEIQTGLRTRFIVQNVSKLPSVDTLVMTNVDVHAIVSTIIHGLKIIATFNWLKPRVKKKHIPGCC